MIVVYIIKNVREDRVVYVGKTINFNKRKYDHLTLHAHTKDWIGAIGTNNVEIIPIECFDTEEEALKREDELILQYDTIENGYNKHRSGLIERGREKEYKNEWYQEHREDINEQQKRYNADHREEKKQYHKEWYQDHREYKKQYNHDYYQAKKLGMTVKEYREKK